MSAPVNPTEKEFAGFAAGRPVAPLIFKTPNDGMPAWTAFAALESRHPFAFLLESADTGENGRYSFMGVAPRRMFRFAGGVFSVLDGEGAVVEEQPCADPLAAVQKRLAALSMPPSDSGELPPFLGGVVGYAGYDCVRCFEPVGEEKPDLLKIPDMLWMQTDWLAVFDHFRRAAYAVKSCYAEDVSDWGECFRRGREEAKELFARMSSAPAASLRLRAPRRPRRLKIKSNMTKAEFCAVVKSFKKHIRAGDIFQGVPSQRLSFAQPASALDIYRCLRRTNPSPYMFYLKCGGFTAAGSSPELMVSCAGRRFEIRPLAGTRPRGATPAQDAALEAELLANEKETAEHLMLVDLGRNDAGRVAAAGTVRVSKFCAVERYSHVMHIMSAVEGELLPKKTAFDALRAAFPAGTLSGAPKVRAMQLINDYEPCRRNLYAGCAGYAGFDGGMSTCIAIRSFTAKDGACHVQAGCGVVADSSPAAEYEETLNKAAAVLNAAEIAGAGG